MRKKLDFIAATKKTKKWQADLSSLLLSPWPECYNRPRGLNGQMGPDIENNGF
jgi:hypothetical protein